MQWRKISPYCLKSCPWMIAKHGGPSPKYLLTHDAKPNLLMWFGKAQEAMDAAESLSSSPERLSEKGVQSLPAAVRS